MYLGLKLDSRLLQILAGFILALGVIASHNFFHLRHNWRNYYWDLSIQSSLEQRVLHALSHHLYPNTLMVIFQYFRNSLHVCPQNIFVQDAEISMFEPVFEFLPKKEKNWLQRYGVIVYSHILYWFLSSSAFLLRWKKILMGQQPFRSEYLIILLEIVVCSSLSLTVMVRMAKKCTRALDMSDS